MRSGAVSVMTRSGAMPLYFLYVLALTWVIAAAGLMALLSALSPLFYLVLLPAFLFPLAAPVAACTGIRHPGLGLGMVGGAALAALAAFALAAGLTYLSQGAAAASAVFRQAVLGSLFVALVPGAGFLLGRAVSTGAPFGRAVAGVTGLIALAALVYGALHQAQVTDAVQELHQELVAQASQSVDAKPDDARLAQLKTVWQWHQENWRYVDPGLLVVALEMAAAMLVAVVAWGMRRFAGVEGLQGTFRTMRPPEWLVWAGIACAGLWMVNRQWPLLEEVEALYWNTALALSGVYFLNGLAVLGFGLTLFKPRPLTIFVVVLMIYLTGPYPMIAFFGLFDTWGSFREKMTQLAARMREQSDDDDA